jgi:cell wall-associated NlpC family hydrolase
MIKKTTKYFSLMLLSISFFAAGAFMFPGCSTSSTALRYRHDNSNSSNEARGRYQQGSEENDFSGNSVSSKPDSISKTTASDEEFDEDFTEEKSVNLDELLNKLSAQKSGSYSIYGNTQEKLLMEIIKFLKTPYKYGGNSMYGIDCSAFTQNVYRNTFSYSLLRSAREQYTQGSIISNRNNLKFGDLIFFNTRTRVKPGHVGIYIGDNYFAHASSRYGVRVSSLDEDYYARKYMGGRRIESLFSNK